MRRTLAAGVLLLLVAGPLAAQQDTLPPRPPVDSLPVPVDARSPAATDTTARRAGRADSVRPRPPISPGGAFLRSFLIPGWGQARLGRTLTAGVFVAFEGVAATMVWKSGWHLEFARTRGKFVDSHIQEQQDWIVLLVFNHFFSAAEAFVSANLWDFPVGLRAQVLPDGTTGLGVTIPLR